MHATLLVCRLVCTYMCVCTSKLTYNSAFLKVKIFSQYTSNERPQQFPAIYKPLDHGLGRRD